MHKNITIAQFTIIVDTREQLPYKFEDVRIDRKKSFVWSKTKTLQTGDYSLECYENRVCVERKSLADLYGTLGRGRERFERELERMQTLDASMVVIEATWQEIAYPGMDEHGNENYNWNSSLSANSVLGTIVAWSRKYPKTHWKAAGNRKGGEKATFEFLRNWWISEQKSTHIVEVSHE